MVLLLSEEGHQTVVCQVEKGRAERENKVATKTNLKDREIIM